MKTIDIEKVDALLKDIWDYAETGFEEIKSSKRMIELLEAEGFQVEKNVDGMDTAFIASFGEGKPVIALLAEYDALSGMSQESDEFSYKPLKNSDKGHGCGHNLLGSGIVGSGLILKDYLMDKEGTIKIYGCPAEESGSGKVYLARDGYFNDVDIALSWHPSLFNNVQSGSDQACIQAYFRFSGRSSHAASSPESGRSALDACELMNIGVNYLREHMADYERVHYAYTNVGGVSPNVVQASGELKYLIRSNNNMNLKKLYERVCNIAKGAALMCEVEVEIIFDEGLSNVLPNYALEEVLDKAFKNTTLPEYSVEELAYAKKFRDSYQEDIFSEIPINTKNYEIAADNIKNNNICNIYLDTIHCNTSKMGSTDIGDVSWVVPTAQINCATVAYGASAHSWQWVAQGKSSIALKGTILASTVLSKAAMNLFEDSSLIEKAKKDFKQQLNGHKYECLIPKDIKPHLVK